jgi:hypothetical protein
MGNTESACNKESVVIDNKIIISVALGFLTFFDNADDDSKNKLVENFKMLCGEVPKNYICINDLTGNPDSPESKLAKRLSIE